LNTKLAINGFGRIGRNVFRALYESDYRDQIEIVAINDLGDANSNAHVLQHDTTHGRFPEHVRVSGDSLVVGQDSIRVYSERNPKDIPWAVHEVVVVLECTGIFCRKDSACLHLLGGAKRVLLSAPAKGDVDATIVYGVNENILKKTDTIFSNASCTTNCLAPLAKVINDTFGIESGLMTTIHAYTNDQVLTDVYHSDLRRARSATQSMIPTSTGAASAVGVVLPELAGKLDGFAMRVPTINVSNVDLTFQPTRATSIEALDDVIKSASDGKILSFNDKPLVSIDFNHSSMSCNYDSGLTRMINDNLIKVCAWYDNDWGFSHRMLDTAQAMAALD